MGLTTCQFPHNPTLKLPSVLTAAGCVVHVDPVFPATNPPQPVTKQQFCVIKITTRGAVLQLLCGPRTNSPSWMLIFRSYRPHGPSLEQCVLCTLLASGGSRPGLSTPPSHRPFKLFVLNERQFTVLNSLSAEGFTSHTHWSSSPSAKQAPWSLHHFFHLHLRGPNGIASCWTGPTLDDRLFVAVRFSKPRNPAGAEWNLINALKNAGAQKVAFRKPRALNPHAL